MRAPCCLYIPSNDLFACVFIAAGRCSPGSLLATVVSSGSTIPAFRCHWTLHPKVVPGVFYAVLVVANTQYTRVVKGR
jgi:hypothetical protein